MGKNKKKSKSKKAAKQQPPPASPALAPAEVALIKELEGGTGGTLSDRLNPDHSAYDSGLKARWKGLSKKTRQQIVAADAQRNQSIRDEGARNAALLPFTATEDDHCESPPEAYADLAATLDVVATALGRTRASLRIYDPYYCSGAVARHLRALGFATIHNEREDFYEVLRSKSVPPHDVVVTNPPYSADHVRRLFNFCVANAKSYCLLLPNYVCQRPEYNLVAPQYYVCPRKRYNYWTPKAFRARDKTQGHVSTLGHRTSPFASFWHVSLAPARREPLAEVRALPPAPGRPRPHYCASIHELPAGARA